MLLLPKLRIRTLVIFFITVSIFSAVADAQDSCPALMKFGIYDQYNTLTTESDFRLVHTWLCDSNFQSYESAHNAGGSAGVDIAGVLGVSAGGGASSQERDVKLRTFCAMTYDQAQHNSLLLQNIRAISPSLMSVVKSCLDNQRTGFAAWIETSKDRSTFSYFARYRPNGDEKAKILGFDITPGEAKTACRRASTYGLFGVGKKIGNAPRVLTCTIDPKTTVTVTLVADKGGPDEGSFVRTLDGVRSESRQFDGDYTLDAAGYSTARQWLDTGLILAPGTQLNITATGRACLAAENPRSCSGPEGVPNANPACASMGIVCGAIYAKIGMNGETFFVGPSLSKTVTASGSLFLGYGDINYLDNTGGFQVHVRATVPPSKSNLRRTAKILSLN